MSFLSLVSEIASDKNVSVKNVFIYVFLSIFLLAVVVYVVIDRPVYGAGIENLKVRSVDTMKFSRDVAREHAENQSFDAVIEKQVSQVVSLNATHIAIGTPYDKEFVPFLKRWVKFARKYNLKIWFRGNLSGWEGWFNYEKIAPEDRKQLLSDFILNNKDIFEDGDIFTSCPECENGVLGYPVGDEVVVYKKFMITEYQNVKDNFRKIGKNVRANFNSMNGDMAYHVMDSETTRGMDGIVTIDHYVHSQERIVADVNNLASISDGKIVLGEIGAPIPDIHGEMTELEQREWLAVLFAKLNKLDNLEGINYWVSHGGSTPLWNSDGSERLAAEVVRNTYGGRQFRANLVDRKGQLITDAQISTLGETYLVDMDGIFSVPYLYKGQTLEISAKGYPAKSKVVLQESPTKEIVLDIEVNRDQAEYSLWDKIWNTITYPVTVIFYLLTGKKI